MSKLHVYQPIQTEVKCEGNHCQGKNDACEPHTCPYKSEINDDDESLCTCCDDCAQECA